MPFYAFKESESNALGPGPVPPFDVERASSADLLFKVCGFSG